MARPTLALLPLVAAFAVAACGSGANAAPTATPTDFEGAAIQLDRVHIGIENVVSGDAGCDDSQLVPTAISFQAVGLDQTTPVKIHLYRFRDGPTYDRLRQSVDACARSYVSDPSAYVTIDARPWVATSAGPWAPGFTGAMQDALSRAAAGSING